MGTLITKSGRLMHDRETFLTTVREAMPLKEANTEEKDGPIRV